MSTEASNRRSLVNKTKALTLSEQRKKALAAVTETTDRHSGLALVIHNQIDTNVKLKETLQKVPAFKDIDLDFITKDNDALTGYRDTLLFAADRKSKPDACCSKLPELTGTNTNELNGKIHKCFVFSGEPPNMNLCQQWLDRCREAARGSTEERWYGLLKKYSEGNLLGSLCSWEREGNTDPATVIPWIERFFGGVLHPTEAKRRLSLLTRKPNESLASMDVRIEGLAEMATVRDDEIVKRVNKDNLKKLTLLRMIPATYKNDLMERELSRLERGDEEFTYRETVNELQLIWVKYEDLTGKKVNAIGEEETEGTTNEENKDDDSINYVSFRRRHFNKGRNFRKVPFHKKRYPQRFGSGRVHQIEEEEPSDEEEYASFTCDEDLLEYEDDGAVCYVSTPEGRRARIFASDFNVERNSCYKCGQPNHKMSGPGSENCPYKNESLTSTCTSCNKGGHRAEVCKQTKN